MHQGAQLQWLYFLEMFYYRVRIAKMFLQSKGQNPTCKNESPTSKN